MRLYKKDPLDPDEYVKYWLDEYYLDEIRDTISCKFLSKPFPIHKNDCMQQPTVLEMMQIKGFNEWLVNNGYEYMDPNKISPLLRQYPFYSSISPLNRLIASIEQDKIAKDKIAKLPALPVISSSIVNSPITNSSIINIPTINYK
jgi:hypothetical protein